MSPKCVYGEHDVHEYGRCSSAPEDGMMCEPEPVKPMDPADLASLMSTEPQEPAVARYCGAAAPGEYGGPDEPCGCTLPCPLHGIPVAAAAERRGDSHPHPTECEWQERAEKAERERDLTKKTQASMSARIQALEGVLEQIRTRAATCRAFKVTTRADDALGDIVTLVNQILTPHQPWCRDESHQGACISDPEEHDDGE